MHFRHLVTAAAAVIVLLPTDLVAQQPRHPLDPLSWQEHWAALEVLREAGHMDDGTSFSFVGLQEPDKGIVSRWKDGQSFPRSAFAVVRDGPRTYEAVIDLAERRVTGWTEVTGIQPQWLDREFGTGVEQAKGHPDFVAAMQSRGITDLSFIDCHTIPLGYFGTEEQRGRRVGYVFCEDARGVRNRWSRSIAGLTVVVDMADGSVIRVVDEGAIPPSTTTAEYDRGSIGAPRAVEGPIHVTQPLGPGFSIDGHRITWQNWSFHVRPDTRVGMVLSLVEYRDGDSDRSVLYQGSLSEIFVPYMDPSFAWYGRNFIDAGEFSASGLTKPLMRGRDCPDHAVYVDHVMAGGDGRPQDRPDMICVFERTAGDVAWRHFGDPPASRPARDLVVRMAAVLGNYDYLFDWVFKQNGSIAVGVGATGIAEAKVVAETDATTPPAGDVRPDAYGRFVAPRIVAVNHDHYFSFRLDLDVDGSTNSLVVDRLKSVTLPGDHPRRSIWVADETVARRESDAKLTIDYNRPALWRVTSEATKNYVGYPTSYQLKPGGNGNTLLSADDYPRRRAGFIDHHLWVTPHAPNERYAAGDYPTLSKPGMGLPEWSAADRPISGTDIVLWYTIGMHHMVRAEDWPVMPVLWHWFELRPFDFFDGNPALDLPEVP
jgi:primary-amine oxidase